MPTAICKTNLVAHINMILYKPTNQLFSNRLEAKLILGHSKFNKIMRQSPDELVFIKMESLASDEKVYSSTE